MTEEIIEIEANSLEEAREQATKQLNAQMPKGTHILSEEIISEGKTKTLKTVADTVDAAFTQAEGEVPVGVDIVERKVIVAPEHKTILIEAVDEQDAKEQARREVGKTATVKAVKLEAEGKKGFLNIGKKPNVYKIRVIQRAVIQITYKEKVKVRVVLGESVPCSAIDPRSIKLVAVFSIGITLNEQDALEGAFLAFGTVNKDFAKYFLDRKHLLTEIGFTCGSFADATEAENVPTDLLRQIPDIDVYVQSCLANVKNQKGVLFIFTCVSGTGKVHAVKGTLIPRDHLNTREEVSKSFMRREFGARDSAWHNTSNELLDDGIQVVDRIQAGKQVRVALIRASNITSLQNNSAFVTAIRSVYERVGVEGVRTDLFIDQRSANNIKLFDQSLYDAFNRSWTITGL